MYVLLLARLQFALTIIYHFFFVPLTIGLSLVVAILETIYVSTGNELYKRMTRFWGKLFLINFAMGVVTGIVQEFQFGMAWSEYSRFVGDIFGAPLAIEALVAFFIESTFLGLWIFGWDKLSKGFHAAVIWIVAVASNISAIWILIANAFMQHPAGYVLADGRAELSSFSQVVFNIPIFTHYPHVLFASMSTAAFFVLGISAYHLIRHNEPEFFQKSMRVAAIIGVIGTIGVGLLGHSQGQEINRTQPMKLASIEALFDTENPASLSIITIANPFTKQLLIDWRIPGALSFMEYNRFTGEVKGINDLQAMYEQQYGPGNYTPPPVILYWSFRTMVGAGLLMILLSLVVLLIDLKNWHGRYRWFFSLLPFAMGLPYLANTAGWVVAEVGRFPWVVYGLVKQVDGVSKVISGGMLLTSLIGFILLYALLLSADIFLMSKSATAGPSAGMEGDEDLAPSLVDPGVSQ